MNWKFWQKKTVGGGAGTGKTPKLSGPKELPEAVGINLVTQKKEDPDFVWSLKWVARPRENQKKTQEFRIFSPAAAASKGVRVTDYNFLDLHPELILFSGEFDKGSGALRLDPRDEKSA